MSKLVFSNHLRVTEGHTINGKYTERELPSEIMDHFRSEKLWNSELAIHNLREACFNILFSLGEASTFVEVIRVTFERNLGGNQTPPSNGVTDIVFEIVFVEPVSKKKTPITVTRVSPSTLLPGGAGGGAVTRYVLDSIRSHITNACERAVASVGKARTAAASLQGS